MTEKSNEAGKDKEIEKIIARIQKLLAMAEDSSSPHEAAIAAGRAAKLLQKYNLDHADVILADIDQSDFTEECTDSWHRRQPRWVDILGLPVAHLHDCEVRNRPTQRRIYTEFLGIREDALVAIYVFEFLVGEINRLAKRYREDNDWYFSPPPSRSDMYDFRLGASRGVCDVLGQLLNEKREKDAETSSGRDLVVVKRALIKEKYGVNYREAEVDHRFSLAMHTGYKQGLKVQIREGVSYEDETAGQLSCSE